MWLLMGKFEDEPIKDLEHAARAKRGFIIAFLFPNTRGILGAQQVLAQSHNNGANLQ